MSESTHIVKGRVIDFSSKTIPYTQEELEFVFEKIYLEYLMQGSFMEINNSDLDRIIYDLKHFSSKHWIYQNGVENILNTYDMTLKELINILKTIKEESDKDSDFITLQFF